METVRRIKPQDGPQTQFFKTSADIIIYGGSAGGGKTFALLMEALWNHDVAGYNAVIFRKNANQVRNPGGLWDNSCELFYDFGGHPKETVLEWSFDSGATIKFAHLDTEKDKYSWQGSQVCCEETTLIRMSNGTKKTLKDIKKGDFVKTLQGNQKVIFIGERRLDNCVSFKNNSINQIHSFTHKVLTSKGWISYSDVYTFYESLLLLIFYTIQFCSYLKYEKCFEQKFQELKQLLDIQFSDLLPKLLIYQSTLDRLVSQGFFSCKEVLSHEIDSELSQYNSQELLQPILTHLQQELLKLSSLLKVDISSLAQVDYEVFYDKILSLLEDFQFDYSVDFHLCDEHIQTIKDTALTFSPSLSGVVVQNQIDLPCDESDIAQKCTCNILHYNHPYTGLGQIAEADQINFQTFEISPIGKKWVIDLTIENDNHYITESGLVNKNCFIGFDELTHFSWGQFVYMLSRNRSLCGIKPYIRATTNPDPDSWVRKFIYWWIDPESGYAIQERSGKIRWFIVQGDETIWADSEHELKEKYEGSLPKSVSFIASNIFDNKILLDRNPEYLANLKALPRFEREQLLNGNWNIRPTSGMFFQRSFFEVVNAAPKNTKKVRYWDRAATKKTESNDPDYTVGLKLEKDQNGILYITDLVRFQDTPLKVQTTIKNTATQDGFNVRIGIEQDPGQAGVSEADYLIRSLSGFPVKAYKATKDKITRSLPVSSQAEAGNIKVVRANWNEDFFKELENFPDSSHDDIIDSLSGAFLMFTEEKYDLNALNSL